ncbi:hypothetical protein L6R52_23555, partial [Myxococcota bacterium]|nr:hypothetical protein [Myxococcota bacterium]
AVTPERGRVEVLDRLTRARSTLDASLVIVAHGRRGRVDRCLGRARGGTGFVGVKQHHVARDGRSLDALRDTVEVFAFDGGYAGIARVDGDRVNVCALVEARIVRGLGRGGWPSIADRLAVLSPPLARRLEALRATDDPPLAVAQAEGATERASRGILFVGDAAGSIAPFAGDGQAMALESARRLSELVVDAPRTLGPADRARLAARWERTWRFHFGARAHTARVLEPLLLRAARTDTALRVIGRVPGLAPALARLTRGG